MNKYNLRHKILNILNEQSLNANIKWIDLSNNRIKFNENRIASYEEFCLTKDQLSKKLKIKVSDVRDQLSYLSSQDEIKTYKYGVKITLKGQSKLSDKFYIEENKKYNFECFKRWCNYAIMPATICSILIGIFIKVISFDPNSTYLNKIKRNIIIKDTTNQSNSKIEPLIIDTSFNKKNILEQNRKNFKSDSIITDSLSNIIGEDSIKKIIDNQ